MKTGTQGVQVGHFACYVPENTVDNDEIMRQMGSSASGTLLYRAVGSKEKRAAAKNEMGSDMLAKVGLQILAQSGTDPASIDKLICSCDPPDHAAPDTAAVVQTKLGLSCPAFGVSMSCVGWILGASIARSYISNGDQRILVLSCSTVGSKFLFRNPMHRAIFGDAAAGALVERGERGSQILDIALLTLGQFYKDIFASYPWTDKPESIPEEYRNAFYMMPDNQLFFNALEKYVVPFFKERLKAVGITPKDVSRFVVHQASMPLFRHTLKVLEIPEEKVPDHFSKYGNTISAELPLYVTQEINSGRIRKGEILCLLTYGAGFTVGSMILRY